jgi:ABC-type transporter MlaC component
LGLKAQTPNEALLNNIWSATHTHDLFESLPLKMPIEEMVNDRFKKSGLDYQNKIQDLLDKNLEPARLQRILQSQLLVRFQPAKAAQFLDFYQTPLGKLYGEAGHQFDPEDPDFKTFIRGPQPSKKRLGQLAKLLAASGSARFASITLVTPIETIFQELEHQKQLAGQTPHKNKTSGLRQSMRSVVKAMHKAMLITASFAYRSLSDAQMKELIAFETSSTAKWYNKALLESYEQTLQVATRRFTKQLLRLLQNSPPQ